MIDPVMVPDVFVEGLGEIEDLGGGVYRLTFYTIHKLPGGEREYVVVARVVTTTRTMNVLGVATAAMHVEGCPVLKLKH